MINSQQWRKWIIGTFVSVPILSSLISTYHLVTLFTLGNPTWLSIFLALTFEAGSIASLLAIPILERVNKTIVWVVFGILFMMQVTGNVYFSFNWVSSQMATNPGWISSFQELFSWIVSTPGAAKIFLAWLVGLPIPLLGTLLSKSLVDYLKIEDIEPITNISIPTVPQPYDTFPVSEDNVLKSFTDISVDMANKSIQKDEQSDEVHIKPNEFEPLNPAHM